jgi:hypothetical protein
MVLVDDQPALGSRVCLRIVGEDPCAGDNHIALQPKRGFVDVVPRLQRSSGLFTFCRRSPADEQVFIVGKEPAVLEYRLGINPGEAATRGISGA